ncbi:hypothetical protein AB0J38_02210 [Streptomyces sp. NPDC050095]|uniref:hypothetical protein n=1 Tax=unclassified Streptomyces TaxID=2593676 RepID=UPI00343A6E94
MAKRRSSAEVQEAKDRVLASRATVIDKYTSGESVARLSGAYGVGATWLADQLRSWGVRLRSRSERAHRGTASMPLGVEVGAGRTV